MAVPRIVPIRKSEPLRSSLVLRPNLDWRAHDVKGEA